MNEMLSERQLLINLPWRIYDRNVGGSGTMRVRHTSQNLTL